METQETPVEETQASVSSETVVQSGEQQIGDEATGNEVKPEDRRNRRAERRIAKLTARNAELAEKLDKERERFEKIESRLDSLGQEAEPQREDFESEDDYVKALVDHRVKSIQPEPVQEQKSGAVDQALIDKFQGFIEETEKGTPGFADMVAKASFPLSDYGLGEIIEMGEDGADVFAHLNQNPADAMRISRLSPREQTIELEKIADSLEVKSSAPEPIAPVSGNDQPVVDENKLSTDDWIAKRNKKVYGF